MSALLVIPCYNEERRLPVDRFRSFAQQHPSVHFHFVDDGSRDGTRTLLLSLATENPPQFTMSSLDRNRGKAEAVRQGMLAALDDRHVFAGYWDADLATPLSEIDLFLEIFAARPQTELVMASRVRLLGRQISRRPARHYVGRIGATLISSSLGLAVYDTQCGAKLFRSGPQTRALFEQPFLSRWVFDVEILARMIEQRGRDAAAAAIYELPIRAWHDVEGSKVKTLDFVRALGDLWRIWRAYGRDPRAGRS